LLERYTPISISLRAPSKPSAVEPKRYASSTYSCDLKNSGSQEIRASFFSLLSLGIILLFPMSYSFK
jgi:hypothetical protein